MHKAEPETVSIPTDYKVVVPDRVLGEAIKQLEREQKQQEGTESVKARTTVQPSNNVPAPQGNILRTKIVVNPLFREVIQLKGSKAIYANIVIDTSQN